MKGKTRQGDNLLTEVLGVELADKTGKIIGDGVSALRIVRVNSLQPFSQMNGTMKEEVRRLDK